jgi:hypothetical protein
VAKSRLAPPAQIHGANSPTILAKIQAQHDFNTSVNVETRGVLRRSPASPLGRACSVCSARPNMPAPVSWRHLPYGTSRAFACGGAYQGGAIGNLGIVGSALRRVRVLDQRPEQAGKLGRHHQLGGWRRAEHLERLQVL